MKIGEYEIVGELGRGGMSVVYEALNPRLGSRHALKVFTYEKDDVGVRRRFEVEGRLLARMAHPRVVKVSDFGVDAETGRPYFAMGLVLDPEGKPRTLADVVAQGVDEDCVGRWYDDLREGLAYIHGQGVVHRDLKLQNVMIGPDGHAVLTDFGVSRVFASQGEGGTVVDAVHTIVNVRDGKTPVMGSIGYMAPELEMGVRATPQSDYYALGVIVFKLLTGTWCDGRTDVASALETYDPVWMKILPALLHTNPAGRECLSYAAECAAARDRREADLEARWLREKSRGHWARHAARYMSLLVVFLLVGLSVFLLRAPERVPSFAELLRVPEGAGEEEVYDDDGNLEMPSLAQFRAARVDALVLVEPVLSDLQSGEITRDKARQEILALRDGLAGKTEGSPFDNLQFGGTPYIQFGEELPLQKLLEQAAATLKEAK